MKSTFLFVFLQLGAHYYNLDPKIYNHIFCTSKGKNKWKNFTKTDTKQLDNKYKNFETKLVTHCKYTQYWYSQDPMKILLQDPMKILLLKVQVNFNFLRITILLCFYKIMFENSMIQIQIKEMCKASNHWCILSNRRVHKEWTQVVKSTAHKFLNTQYKNCSRYIILSKTNHNHQRDQHG